MSQEPTKTKRIPLWQNPEVLEKLLPKASQKPAAVVEARSETVTPKTAKLVFRKPSGKMLVLIIAAVLILSIACVSILIASNKRNDNANDQSGSGPNQPNFNPGPNSSTTTQDTATDEASSPMNPQYNPSECGELTGCSPVIPYQTHVNSPTEDKCATGRSGPGSNNPDTGCIPNGTNVWVLAVSDDPDPSFSFNGNPDRALIMKPDGTKCWVAAGTLDRAPTKHDFAGGQQQ